MKRTLLLLTLLTVPTLAFAQAPTPADLTYGGTNFRALAADSYKIAGLSGEFTTWLSDAYAKAGVPLEGAKTLDAALAARKAAFDAAKTPAEKDALARDTGAWAHKFIKKVVPKFSLERGYEFASIVKTGERQCLLQSTIITSLLQKAGMESGLVMVWKSMAGQESNLGHVTSVLRLPSGAGDVQVDASEPEPFATHSGLLAWVNGGYRFVDAQFGKDGLITAYNREDGKGSVKPEALSFLSLNYVKSQYDYYRAERAIGGVLGYRPGQIHPQRSEDQRNLPASVAGGGTEQCPGRQCAGHSPAEGRTRGRSPDAVPQGGGHLHRRGTHAERHGHQPQLGQR